MVESAKYLLPILQAPLLMNLFLDILILQEIEINPQSSMQILPISCFQIWKLKTDDENPLEVWCIFVIETILIKLKSLRKKCPCLKLFWSVFSRIWIEYREARNISPYLVTMRENADQNNSDTLRTLFTNTDTFHAVNSFYVLTNLRATKSYIWKIKGNCLSESKLINPQINQLLIGCYN